jgi:hypothetical protein
MIKEIGKVNFGTVFEVERVEDGKRFAQKVFAIPEKGSIVKYLNNNMKEALLIKTLKHPNII